MKMTEKLHREADRLRSCDYSGEERGRAWRAATLLDQAAVHIEPLPGEPTFAETSWCADDLTEHYEMTAEEASAWLKENEDALREATILAGSNWIGGNVKAELR